MTGRAVYSEDKEVRRYAQELLLQDAVEIWNLIESEYLSLLDFSVAHDVTLRRCSHLCLRIGDSFGGRRQESDHADRTASWRSR